MIDVIGTLQRGWRQLIAHVDFPLLFITLAIMSIGLVTVYSATIDGNQRVLAQLGREGGPASPEGLREMGRAILDWTKRQVAGTGAPGAE